MTTTLERVRASLAEIERTDPLLRAWVHVDARRAQADAELVDERVSRGETLALAGLSVGVKDIFDIAGLPTEAGFAPFAGRVASQDASCVAALRRAGAVIVGKTVTTQFAVGDPPITRNPWNLARTPGGSSAGSAAAVAAGHVDLALGSQTAGSTLRPAAYCGVVGFKPAFDTLPRDGMLPLAASLDHVGLFAGTVKALVPAYHVLTSEIVDDTLPPSPRLGVWPEPAGWAAQPVRDAFESTLVRMREAGAWVAEAPAPLPYDDILAIHATIMATEAADAHQRLYPQYRDHYAPRVRAMVEVGFATPAQSYARALRLRDRLRDIALAQWAPFDAIVLPTADTVAPTPETTGNRALQAAATLLGLPSISLPIGFDAGGMPIGLQLIAPRLDGGGDLLRIASWVEGEIALTPRAPLPCAGEGE